MSTVERAKAGKWWMFPGWLMCGAAVIFAALENGLRFYGFGVLFKPLQNEFGWSRTQTSVAFTTQMIEGGIEAPIVGWAIDKWGPRKLLWFGAVVMGLGFILLGQTQQLWQFYAIYILVIGIGGGASAYAPAFKAMNDWFVKRRATAMGVISAGGAAGGIVSMGLAWGIIQFGWRKATMLGGAILWLVCIPVGLIFRPHPPEYYGMHRDGQPPEEGKETAEEASAVATERRVARDFTVRQALRTRAFWLVVLVGIIYGSAGSAVAVHIDPLLMDLGASAQLAAAGLAWFATWKIPGRLLISYVADRIGARNAYIISLALILLGLLMMVRATTPFWVFVSMSIYGFGGGPQVTLPSALIAEYFGREHFAKIQGWRTGLSVVGVALGPVFSGWMWDITQSYTISFIAYSAATAVGLAAIWFVRRPVHPEEKAPSKQTLTL